MYFCGLEDTNDAEYVTGRQLNNREFDIVTEKKLFQNPNPSLRTKSSACNSPGLEHCHVLSLCVRTCLIPVSCHIYITQNIMLRT